MSKSKAKAYLLRVERAAAAKRKADTLFISLVLDSVAAGASYQDVATAAGVSKSRIAQIVRTNRDGAHQRIDGAG